MKFLIDNALSPLVAQGLQKEGYDVVHVREYNLQTAEDDEIFDRAVQEERILVSADTDFGTILAIRKTKGPSIILFRREVDRNPVKQIELLKRNIPALKELLRKGVIVVLEHARLRIRELPID